jgi:hypothetical protein
MLRKTVFSFFLVFAALKLKIKWEQRPVCRYHLLTGQKLKKGAVYIRTKPVRMKSEVVYVCTKVVLRKTEACTLV